MSPEFAVRAVQSCLSWAWYTDINNDIRMLAQCPYQNRGALESLCSYFYLGSAPFLSVGELEEKECRNLTRVMSTFYKTKIHYVNSGLGFLSRNIFRILKLFPIASAHCTLNTKYLKRLLEIKKKNPQTVLSL